MGSRHSLSGCVLLSTLTNILAHPSAADATNDDVANFLSRNDDKPRVFTTPEEKLWANRSQIAIAAEKHRNDFPKSELVIGLRDWNERIVKPIVGDIDAKQGLATLFINPSTYDFLSHTSSIAHFCDGRTLTHANLVKWLRPFDGVKGKIAPNERVPDTAGGVCALLLSFAFIFGRS